MPKIRGRFYITPEDGLTVVDSTYGACVSFESQRQANGFAKFIRDYVRKHGDVSLYSAPYDLDSPFTEREKYMNEHEGNEPEDHP